MTSYRCLQVGLATLLASTALGLAFPASATEVTYERLLKSSAEPQNWLMREGNYANWNSSRLTQINRGNVANLKMKFMRSLIDERTPTDGLRQYFTPLVEDGFMYVGNSRQTYWKFDVRSDKATLVWKYDAKDDPKNRPQSAHSVALLGNNMYFNTAGPIAPRLIAVNTTSGETVFDVNTETRDVLPGQGHSAQPVAVKNLMIIGQSRGDSGNRGYLAAHDATTGKLVWRWLAVPNAGEPGAETWADARTLPTGGGAIWTEPSFDPETNLLYIGTGNPVHMFDPQGRPGDNLFTDSIVALDVDTGKMKWFFQQTPNEAWDYDSVAITQIYDVDVGGQARKLIGQTNRNGFFYNLERTSGQFLAGGAFTPVNWTGGIDPKTGKPVDFDPKKSIQDYAGKAPRYGAKAISVQPAHYGMPTMFPNYYDASTHLTYVSFMEGTGNYFNSRPADPAKQLVGNGFREIFCGPNTKANDVEPIERSAKNPNCKVSHGVLAAIDVLTGKVTKKIETKYPAYSGVLGTDGGLLVYGDEMGKLMILDKDSMKELWSFDTGTSFANNPMTYSVDGKQYIATILGGRHGRDEGSWPEEVDVPLNEMLIVFGL